jgi:hypothetical protein
VRYLISICTIWNVLGRLGWHSTIYWVRSFGQNVNGEKNNSTESKYSYKCLFLVYYYPVCDTKYTYIKDGWILMMLLKSSVVKKINNSWLITILSSKGKIKWEALFVLSIWNFSGVAHTCTWYFFNQLALFETSRIMHILICRTIPSTIIPLSHSS